MTTAVGASHRLPSAARLGVVRRNSLRSLRELRSDKAPQVRSRIRASRADPEAALLGAADIAAAGLASALGAPWAHPAQPPNAALETSVVHGWKAGPSSQAFGGRSRTPQRYRQRRGPWGAQRGGPSALGAPCAQPRSAGAPACARSALRTSDSRRLFERSSRSERSEFRRAGRRSEHRRAPPRSGGKHPARQGRRARPAARPTARAFARVPLPAPSTVNCIQGTERRRRKKSNERSLPGAFTSMHIGNHP
jgi:hypothetical protein